MYQIYLADCLEWGGQPMTYEEFKEDVANQAQEKES